MTTTAKKTNGKNGRGYLGYTTYVFKNKDPIIDVLRTVVEDSQQSYRELEGRTRVSQTTMRNWFHGETRRPQFASINAVFRACGKTLKPVSYHKRER